MQGLVSLQIVTDQYDQCPMHLNMAESLMRQWFKQTVTIWGNMIYCVIVLIDCCSHLLMILWQYLSILSRKSAEAPVSDSMHNLKAYNSWCARLHAASYLLTLSDMKQLWHNFWVRFTVVNTVTAHPTSEKWSTWGLNFFFLYVFTLSLLTTLIFIYHYHPVFVIDVLCTVIFRPCITLWFIWEFKGVVPVEFKCETMELVLIFKYADSRLWLRQPVSVLALFHIEYSKEMFARNIRSLHTCNDTEESVMCCLFFPFTSKPYQHPLHQNHCTSDFWFVMDKMHGWWDYSRIIYSVESCLRKVLKCIFVMQSQHKLT